VCSECGFRAYSAAGYASVDECPACGRALPMQRPLTGAGRGLTGVAGLADPPRTETRTEALRREIKQRLGSFPVFFEPASANPAVLSELWRQTQREWLQSPVPSHFRFALLALLAAHSPWPWRAIAAESEAARVPEAELILLSQRSADTPPVSSAPLEGWPESGTPENDELLSLTLRLLLNGPDQYVRTRLQELLGEARYASLVAVLTYLESLRVYAQAHPGLAATARTDRRASDPADAAIFELDLDGVVRRGRAAVEALFGRRAGEVAGRPLTELFERGSHPALARVIAEIAEADPRAFHDQSLRVEGLRTDGTRFEASVTVTNPNGVGGGGLVAIVRDLGPANRRATQAAAHRVLLGLVGGTAQRLPPTRILDALAQSLGWEVAFVWRLDPTDGLLRCGSLRELSRETPSWARERAAASFPPGAGNVGAAFVSGEAHWVEDLGAAPWDADAAVPGMKSGLWLPIGPPGEVVGVIELFSSAHQVCEPVLLEMLAAIARNAGELLETGDTEQASEPRPEFLSGARLAFEAAPLGMALVSLEPGREGVITEANRAMALLIGTAPSELVGRSFNDLMSPEGADVDAELMEELLAGSIPSYQAEKPFRRADGEVFWAELNVSLIRSADDGSPLYVVAHIADISGRKRVEEALHTSRERLASAFDEAPVGMAIATPEGRWLQVNATLSELLGYDESELLSKRLADLVHPDDIEAIDRYVSQLLDGEVVAYHLEARALRADEQAVWVQFGLSLVHDYDGTPAYLLIEVQDVSERKRLEQEVERGTLYDRMTGLPSRNLLFDRLTQARVRLQRTDVPFAVMFVRAEGLRRAGDALGPERSANLLREVAARLLAAVRAGDTVARYSADEFFAICEDLESREEADVIVGRIVELGRMVVGEEGAGAETIEMVVGTWFVTGSDASAAPTQMVETAAAASRKTGSPAG
jgi:PAS domain S-box-containing protein/diguanylate cyclase (GGDEF)-like protein